MVVPTNADGNPCHQVDYVTRTPIPLSKSLTLTYTITGTNPVFAYQTETGNTSGNPPHLTFILDASQSDPGLIDPALRWYAYPTGGPAASPLTLGTHTITVPLAFASWGDAAGTPPGTAAQFNGVLASAYQMGSVLGGGNAQGHGLYLKSGSATLTINSLTSP